jgi:hypothetical protein
MSSNIRKILNRMSMQELAANYVQMTRPTVVKGRLYTAWDLRQEMLRRIGNDDMVRSYIDKAQEIYELLGGDQRLNGQLDG